MEARESDPDGVRPVGLSADSVLLSPSRFWGTKVQNQGCVPSETRGAPPCLFKLLASPGSWRCHSVLSASPIGLSLRLRVSASHKDTWGLRGPP